MRLSTVTTAALLVAFAFIGCRRSATSNVEQPDQIQASRPDWKLVTVHIEGFKKSKSGGT